MDRAEDTAWGGTTISPQLEERLRAATAALLQQPAGDQGPVDDLDPQAVALFKVIRADVDGDGELETCFAAGEASPAGPGIVGLVDERVNGDGIVVLTPRLWGFRDLQVDDLVGDGLLEIITTGQQGSGAYLSVTVHRWDGAQLHELFSGDGWHQGLVERKDLDADGTDELVLWSSTWDTDEAHWDPKPYTIEVFSYQPHEGAYRLASTRPLDRRYWPAAITSSGHGGLFGVSMTAEQRFRSLDEDRRRLRELVAAGQVTDEYLSELGQRGYTFQDEAFYADAIAVAQLLLEGAEELADPGLRAFWRTVAWRARAVNLSLLGRYGEAIASYGHAIESWVGTGVTAERLQPFFGAGMRRELAMHLAMVGDYEEALASLAVAEAELDALDQGDREVRDETSRLWSNRGLVATWLGDRKAATAAFERAIQLDTELGRSTGLAINQTSLGNLYREAGRLTEAIGCYDRALAALGEVSDRDREADARLELGRTLLEQGRHDEAAAQLDLALLLTSVGNLLQQGAKHHLYLGAAGRALGHPEAARRHYTKVLEVAGPARTPETRWQALYGLALVERDAGRPDRARGNLAQAINTIEQLRSQYLPEQLKLSMLAPKSKPYEDMVLLAASPAEAFEYVERAKSRVFVEGLAGTRLTAGGLPTDLVEREATAIRRLHALQAARLQPGAAGDMLAAQIDDTERDLVDLRTRLREVGRRGEEYVDLRMVAPATFEQARDLLARDGNGVSTTGARTRV